MQCAEVDGESVLLTSDCDPSSAALLQGGNMLPMCSSRYKDYPYGVESEEAVTGAGDSTVQRGCACAPGKAWARRTGCVEALTEA